MTHFGSPHQETGFALPGAWGCSGVPKCPVAQAKSPLALLGIRIRAPRIRGAQGSERDPRIELTYIIAFGLMTRTCKVCTAPAI